MAVAITVPSIDAMKRLSIMAQVTAIRRLRDILAPYDHVRRNRDETAAIPLPAALYPEKRQPARRSACQGCDMPAQEHFAA
jgi:hypothetical protein